MYVRQVTLLWSEKKKEKAHVQKKHIKHIKHKIYSKDYFYILLKSIEGNCL